jgi:hypothetical protein
LSHEEVVDVNSDHSLERGSTGHLVFWNPLHQLHFRFDEGSQIRSTRSTSARHPTDQEATG